LGTIPQIEADIRKGRALEGENDCKGLSQKRVWIQNIVGENTIMKAWDFQFLVFHPILFSEGTFSCLSNCHSKFLRFLRIKCIQIKAMSTNTFELEI